MSFLRNTRKNRLYIKNRNKKINTFKNNYSRNINRKSLAGKPIAEGGFGCVFKPALKCKNLSPDKNLAPDKNYVSKLMFKKNAEEEMKLIKYVGKTLTRIPYYAEYFLVKGAYMCNPSKLTTNDKKGFNEKCSSLYRKNITQKNINDKLHKLKAISLPYGGLDLDIFWSKWNKLPPSKRKHKSFGVTNICLINLLNRGIKIMNLKDFYHLDLKGSNILRTVSPKNIYITDNVKTRVIDWGLSMRRSNKKTIPLELTDRPFQFNLPFSSILFQSNIQETINEYVKKFKQKKDKSDFSNIDGIIKKGLATHIYDTAVYRLGDGHLGYMIPFIDKLYKPLGKNTAGKSVGKEIICGYLEEIFNKYIDKHYQFDVGGYLNNIFLKNVDIWGFIVSYNDLITEENPWKSNFQSIIVKILTEYCFGTKYSTKVIPIKELMNKLLQLNKALGEPLKYKNYPEVWNLSTPKITPLQYTRKIRS